MSSVYIHIPFCASRCLYCDFYSTTSSEELQQGYVAALKSELCQRIGELGGEPIDTIYIGGGTPSQLKGDLLVSLFGCLLENLDVSSCKEITLEVNPDDITPDYLRTLASTPVNRISMGVQSFNDAELRFLGRRHNAAGAVKAFDMLRSAGYGNISIDLIFSLPGQTMDIWSENLRCAVSLDPEHISAYNLSYEPGTRMSRMLDAGDIAECDEETSFEMYSVLIDTLSANGYGQYEISNFARPGFRSRHNGGYWRGVPYLGLGAAAHSYDGTVRRANIGDIKGYIKRVSGGEMAYTEERLTKAERYDEMVYTSLRTMDGLDLAAVEKCFGSVYLKHCLTEAEPYIEAGDMIRCGDRLKLTRKGIFISDAICRSLFY